ncbi:hypothetical protein ACFL3G_02660 [Planctomycetota bacterium]
MRIKWENIIPLVVIITLIVLLVKLPSLLESLSDDFGALHSSDGDPVFGLMSLGLICVTVLAIFKVISNNKR